MNRLLQTIGMPGGEIRSSGSTEEEVGSASFPTPNYPDMDHSLAVSWGIP